MEIELIPQIINFYKFNLQEDQILYYCYTQIIFDFTCKNRKIMNSSQSAAIKTKRIQLLKQNLTQIYSRSSIFVAKQSKLIFKNIVNVFPNCPSIQISNTEDYLYRILYYFILYYSFESGDLYAKYLVDSLTKMLVKYEGDFYCPPSITNNKIKLSVKEIHQYYFQFLSQARSSVHTEKLIKLLNKGIHMDYIFMQIMHTLISSCKQLSEFLRQIGIKVYIFKEGQILLDDFLIKFNRNQTNITFKIQRKQFCQELVKNQNIDLCLSIGTVQQQVSNSLNQQLQKGNFYGFLATARHANSFYNSRDSEKHEKQGLFNQNDTSLSQLTQVIGSIQKIQLPSTKDEIFSKKTLKKQKQLNPQSPCNLFQSRRARSQNHQDITPFNVSTSKIKKYKVSDQENYSKFLRPYHCSYQDQLTIKKSRKRKLVDHARTSSKSFYKKQLQFVRAVNQIFIPTNPRQVIESPKKSISTMKTSIEKSGISHKIQQSFYLSINATPVARQLPRFSYYHQIPTSKIKTIKSFFKNNKGITEKE